MAGRTLTVPTIFTAVDRLSGVIDRMKRSVGGFAGKTSIAVNALNRGFNSLIPSVGRLAKQFIGFAASAAIFGGIAFSVTSILHYEKNLAQLHGLLNNLTDNAFVPYRKEVDKVARATRYASTDVADAFTKIAERNIALAKTPEILGAVTTAAITLSRAAKMELVPATDALVNVLYQFGLAGKDSNRVINVLAAGMKYGSSNIENQIEAYKKFAVTAKGANMTLEQSNALIQTVAHQVQGSDAGTALRNIILNLQRYKEVYKDGKFDMSYALNKTAEHFKKLGTEQKQNIFLQDLFGKRQVNVARQLLGNIPLYEDLTKKITGTNEAQNIANQNTNNVIDKWTQLKNTFVNYLTSNDDTLKGLNKLKEFIGYVTDNLDTIIDRVVTFGKFLIGLKVAIWSVQAALFVYNVTMGIMGAVTGVANIAIGESAVAMGAYRLALMLGIGPTITMGTSVGGMAGSFTAANVAAEGFFATLSSFVIPAALIGLGGLAIWKVINGDGTHTATENMKPKYFSRKNADTQSNPFGSKNEESDYQSWWLDQSKKYGSNAAGINRMAFDDKFHAKYNQYEGSMQAFGKVPVQTTAGAQQPGGSGNLNININDKANKVDSVVFTGHNHLPIGVKVTSTTGNK